MSRECQEGVGGECAQHAWGGPGAGPSLMHTHGGRERSGRSLHLTKDVDWASIQREAIKLIKGTGIMSWEEGWRAGGQGREKSIHMVKPMKDFRGSIGSGSCLCLQREHLGHWSQTAAQGSRHTQLKYVLDKHPVRNITRPVYHWGRGERPAREYTYGRDFQERAGSNVAERLYYINAGEFLSLSWEPW